MQFYQIAQINTFDEVLAGSVPPFRNFKYQKVGSVNGKPQKIEEL